MARANFKVRESVEVRSVNYVCTNERAEETWDTGGWCCMQKRVALKSRELGAKQESCPSTRILGAATIKRGREHQMTDAGPWRCESKTGGQPGRGQGRRTCKDMRPVGADGWRNRALEVLLLGPTGCTWKAELKHPAAQNKRQGWEQVGQR